MATEDPREVEAKLALDAGLAGLAAQRTNLQELQSRAKDIVGLLTLAASFLGAFGKSNVNGVFDELRHKPDWVMWLFVALPLLTLAFALYVMVPRGKWIFGVDAESIRTSMLARPVSVAFANNEDLYLDYVDVFNGFQLRNRAALKRRMYAVWCAMLFLAATIVMVGILVLSGSSDMGGH